MRQKLTTVLLALVVTLTVEHVGAADFSGHINRSSRDSTPQWVDAVTAPSGAPNVLVILLDDTGFADLGPFGSEIDTPNIDRLAANGLRYNSFTSTAVCSPSRAALLTGLNHHSAGVGWLANMDGGYPGYRGELARDVMTLPEVLRENGYSTMMVGKWHLTNSEHLSPAGPFDSWPLQRGFEQFWGILDGEANQFMPAYLYRGNQVIDAPADGSFYFPDAMTETALAMLRDQRAVDRHKPWFLYFATGASHAPHHTREVDRLKYRGLYNSGYDDIRRARLQRQKDLGIAPQDTRLTGYYPGVRPWSELDGEERLVSARLQENYAAFVDNIDQQVGKLLDYLREVEELDNTLIILTSDNGGSKETGTVGTTMATRYFNGLLDTTARNLEDIDLIGGPDSHPNYPHGWMQVSNTPFAYSKAKVHGGGVRSPLFLHWPAGIQARGEIRSQFHHMNDLMPTILELTSAVVPETYRGTIPRAMEGASMRYSLDAPDAPTRKLEQYYEIEANRGLVVGDWKIVTAIKPGNRYDSSPWELYNLREDFSESRNLATEYPDKVDELEQRWWQLAEQYQVLPVHDQSISTRGRAALSRMENVHYRRFDYQPGADSIHPVRAPLLNGREFSISVDVENFARGDSGVLVAQGGYDVGYSFYVLNDYLHYEVNIGGYRTRLRSEDPLPAGPLTLGLRYRRGGDGKSVAAKAQGGNFTDHGASGGLVTLLVNGEAAGSAQFSPSVPHNTWEGLDIGRDRRTAVSDLYQAPFTYSGVISRARYTIDRPPPDGTQG